MRTPRACVACGCTDYMACIDEDGDGCFWIDYFSAGAVCTECWELVVRAERAGRYGERMFETDAEFSAERFAALLGDLYPSDDARAWFDSPQTLLDGKSPRELVLAGEIVKVRTVVQQLIDGAYV